MSESLKKLIDINRLREFKNKLVEVGSAYVQTAAVDQTVAGTKTFSKPIVGSVTGSSGSCTGNAASANIATKADSATKAANADHATKADSATNATYANWLRTSSNSDHLLHIEWKAGHFWTYVTTGSGEYRAVKVARSNSSGNADTATKLATARTIALSGAATGTATAFDGSGNITIPVTSLDASKLTGTASVSTTGNAATATQFSANATVALTGDATGTSAGSKKGWSVPVTLANSGVTAGTYGPSADVTGNHNATISVPEITVDAKGRVTSVTNRTLTCKNNLYNVYNKTLTIQKNGTNVATFTSNSNTNVTANITVPTKVSELTNDSGFLTSHQSLSNYVTLNGAQTISGAKTFTGNIIGINKDNSTEDANDLYSTTAGSKLTYYTTTNSYTRLTNVPAAVNTTLESRTIRKVNDSDWIVEQICHNSNGLYYRKGSNGTWGAWKTFAFTDSNISGNAATATTATTAKACTGNAATATKLAAKRTIALSGAATGTATSFDGSGNITIPVTSLDASKLTGTASVSTTGNAASANIATKATQDSDGNKITTTYSKNGHTHDDRYYTENEVNNLLNGKANTSGTYSNLTVGNADSATKAANADHATSADSATRATSADRASAANCVLSRTSDYHEISFDWYSQVPDHVGLWVDATAMGGIVTTNRLVSDIRAQWYAAYPDGPEAHNAMWGGRDITAAFNAGTVSEHIADGTFKDIFPGDYITKQVTISGKTYTVNWVIADCDYWINKGDTAMTAHHVAIVPQAPIFKANMNATNTAEGGYAGSRMYRETIPACATGIVSAFGSGHILTFRDAITNSVDTSHVSSGAPFLTGASSDWGWYDARCNLMSEAMVYGGPHCASSTFDNIMATRQMSAFRLSERLINYNRWSWWFRDVLSSACFARVGDAGNAGAGDASDVCGVRPFALLK